MWCSTPPQCCWGCSAFSLYPIVPSPARGVLELIPAHTGAARPPVPPSGAPLPSTKVTEGLGGAADGAWPQQQMGCEWPSLPGLTNQIDAGTESFPGPSAAASSPSRILAWLRALTGGGTWCLRTNSGPTRGTRGGLRAAKPWNDAVGDHGEDEEEHREVDEEGSKYSNACGSENQHSQVTCACWQSPSRHAWHRPQVLVRTGWEGAGTGTHNALPGGSGARVCCCTPTGPSRSINI